MADSDKPVIEGQVLDVTIDDISKTGDAVAHVDRYVVFVKGAQDNDLWPQQEARIQILKVRPRFAIAEVFKGGRS